VQIAGRENIPTGVPIIFACTHGSWWDAAITIVLSLRVLKLDAIGMMEYKQLVKYRFFSRIGMFSVIRDNPRSALRSLRYAANMLRSTTQALWMFPQGMLVHQEQRPLVCEPGLTILASMIPSAVIVPVAIRYEMLREQGGVVWIRCGARVTSDVCRALEKVADQVRADAMAEDDSAYTVVINGKRSMEKKYDRVRN